MSFSRNEEHDQPLILLGHQRGAPRLRSVLDRWSIQGPVALAAPGWEEDEVDDAWVRESVGCPLVNLQLYELADRLFAEDPEVLQLLRQRQDELRRLREINRIQLDHLLAVARDLLRRELRAEPVSRQVELALQQVRDVDRDYLELVSDVIRDYDRRIDPKERASVRRYRARILERFADCRLLLLAGGHVGVLLNRLNLSRLLRHIRVPVVAWSGGAMAMSEKIVFYHHSLPHATCDAELSRRGVHGFHSLLVFPRAESRLALDSQLEVALLARRFSDDHCLALKATSELEWSPDGHFHARDVQKLEPNGTVVDWQP